MKFRFILASILILLAVAFALFGAIHTQPITPVQATATPASTAPSIDYTLQLSVDYRTQGKSDVHIRRYADVTVWTNRDQVVSHVLHNSTRDLNEVETRQNGVTLVVVFRAHTNDLLFPHINSSVLRSDIHLSIAESTQYVNGVYEYIAAVTEY